jgi:hypothetical protein
MHEAKPTFLSSHEEVRPLLGHRIDGDRGRRPATPAPDIAEFCYAFG